MYRPLGTVRDAADRMHATDLIVVRYVPGATRDQQRRQKLRNDAMRPPSDKADALRNKPKRASESSR